MQKVKFSVFADIHIEDHWAPDSIGRLQKILGRAKREQVDFVIHCGDFCTPPDYPEAIEIYNGFEIPTYHVLGNHDFDKRPHDEVIAAFGMTNGYYYFDKNGFRFIVLDENYCRIDGVDVPYAVGNYFKHGDCRDYISQEQIAWLEDTVMSSPYPMILFSHGSLQREDVNGGAVRNREDVQDIFRRAHSCGKRILMCINGHYHVDYMRIYEHVCYFDVNSATMYTLCEKHEPHGLFGEEFHKKHPGSAHLAIYNDPIHAIVTVSEDGCIEIEGMESSFFKGVSKEMISSGSCHQGIKITPRVLSEKIILPMKL